MRLIENDEQAGAALLELGLEEYRNECRHSPAYQAELDARIVRRAECIPLIHNYDTFNPGPSAKALAFHNSMATTKGFLGANRSSKSYTWKQEVCHHVLGEYPPWWTGRRYNRPVRIRVCAPTYDEQIKQIILIDLRMMLPQGYIAREDRNGQGQITSFTTVRGDFIQFMSYNQDVKVFESSSFDLVVMDEPPSLDIFSANCTRVIDTEGYVIICATVIREQAWIYDALESRKNEAGEVFIVHTKMIDNPIMTPEKVARAEAMIPDEEERRARIHGVPVILAGRVFQEVSREIHVVPFHPTPEPDYCNYMVLDPHPRKSWCMAGYAINRHGEKFVTWEEVNDLFTYKVIALTIAYRDKKISQEEYEQCLSWDESAIKPLLRRRFAERGLGTFVWTRIADTSGMVPDQATGIPQLQVLGEYGIYFTLAKKMHNQGVTTLHDWLNPNPRPMLYFMDNCPEHIHQFEFCVWDNYQSGLTRDRKNPMPKVREKGMDCVFMGIYMANYNPQYCFGALNPPPAKRPRRLRHELIGI